MMLMACIGYTAPPRPPSAAARSSAAVRPVPIFRTELGQQPNSPRAPSEYHLNLGRLVDTLHGDHPLLFDRPPDLSLFVDTVELHGPSGQRLRGLSQYAAVFDLLRFVRRVAMHDATLTHRITTEDRSVRMRWSAKLYMMDPTFGLTSLVGEPVVVHVDGVSAYDLDGRGRVHVHRLENVVLSGGDRDLLDMPNLELMWRLPALVPPVAMPVPAGGRSFATLLRRACDSSMCA